MTNERWSLLTYSYRLCGARRVGAGGGSRSSGPWWIAGTALRLGWNMRLGSGWKKTMGRDGWRR